MSWLKRVTGIQELINDQKRATELLFNIYVLIKKNEKEKPVIPATKKYK